MLLQERSADPEEVLTNLGFTAAHSDDAISRVPGRFLSTKSAADGINITSLLEDNNELQKLLGLHDPEDFIEQIQASQIQTNMNTQGKFSHVAMETINQHILYLLTEYAIPVHFIDVGRLIELKCCGDEVAEEMELSEDEHSVNFQDCSRDDPLALINFQESKSPTSYDNTLYDLCPPFQEFQPIKTFDEIPPIEFPPIKNHVEEYPPITELEEFTSEEEQCRRLSYSETQIAYSLLKTPIRPQNLDLTQMVANQCCSSILNEEGSIAEGEWKTAAGDSPVGSDSSGSTPSTTGEVMLDPGESLV